MSSSGPRWGRVGQDNGSEGRRQEYRMHVGGVPVLLWPGLDDDGRLDLSGIDDALPVDRDDPFRW